jgi:maleylpyruvate isomerase
MSMSTSTLPFSLSLQGYWRSSASWRVRVALELKGLDYTYEPVHLVRGGGEQHAPDFVTHSPMHQVPVLTLTSTEGGSEGVSRRFTQSLAIIALLDELAPQHLMIPRDPWQKARALELAEVINAGTQPLQNLSVLQKVEALGGDKMAWASEVIERGLSALEALCQAHPELTARPFLMGAQPGVVEACLMPQLYNARRFSVELTPFERLLEIEARCEALPAFQRAAPNAQPDAQRV